ncbi:MAG: hypothetical protein LBL56_04885, partial [Treponema sp.]|nr:hypothetical protein [Treponema sp.]
MMNCDVLIVGAGPAGIFTALEIIRLKKKKNIIIMEKGRPIEKRACPKINTKKCMSCKPFCHITTGFSGAGAFSDGKLSLSCEVGGDLPDLIGRQTTQELIDYTDSVYLEFGAVPVVEGLDKFEETKDIRRRAIKAGLKLVDCPIRHLGTEKAQELYCNIQQYLIEQGVEILFETECVSLVLEQHICKGVRAHQVGKEDYFEVRAASTIVAAGRRGAEWLEGICRQYDILHEA